MTREEKHKRDEKYIEELSTLLPNFRKVREGVYRFFCIFLRVILTIPDILKGIFIVWVIITITTVTDATTGVL